MNALIDLVEPLLGHDDRRIVAAEAARLLASLSHHPEIVTFGPSTESLPAINLSALSAIGEKIRRKRWIDSCPIAAMITSPAPEGHQEKHQHDILRAWITAAALGLRDNSAHAVAIVVGCRRVRLAQRPSEAWLMQILHQLNFATTLGELVQWLATAREQFSGETPTEDSGERMVAALHVPLRDFLMQRQAVRRKREPSGDIFVARPATGSADGLDVRELIALAGESVPQEEPERAFDRPVSSRHYDVRLHAPGAHRQHLGIQVMQARELARGLSIRALLLPCDFPGLTRHEVTVLLRETFPGAARGLCADLALCLSLCLGLEIARMPSLRFVTESGNVVGETWTLRNDEVFLSRWPELPNHHKGRVAPLLTGRHGWLMLAIPKALAEFRLIKALTGAADGLDRQVDGRLSEINKQSGLRLTLGRISNHLHTSLIQQGQDRARAALIAGKPAKAYPQLHYHTDDAMLLENIHAAWLRDLLADAGLEKEKLIPCGSDVRVGSNLSPNPDLLQRYSLELHKRLDFDRRSGLSRLIGFHNEFVLYSLELLNLGTGHRPVDCPYESLLDIDVTGQLIYISDKENRSGGASRVIALPEVALAQISHVRSQLETLISHNSVVGEVAVRAAAKALEGDGPFLFFISKDQSIDIVTPKLLNERFRDRWPLPLNWTRHWMRSSLARVGVEGDLIDAWMGHADFGQEALGRWSGLSIKDLRHVALAVGKIMCEIGFGEVPGWPRRSK